MTRGVSTLPAGLTALIVLVLLRQTCSAKDTDHCAPSSCGNILNINSPFRLKGDPANCGDPRYSLSCEDNQTVLNLFAGKYYVQEINYTDRTIRLVDSGIQKDDYSSIPRYLLSDSNFFGNDIYWPSDSLILTVVFLNCEKPINSPFYLNKSTCFDSGVYSFNSPLSQSKGFRYVTYGRTTAGEVEDLCQVEKIFWTSELGVPGDPRNISCTDFHKKLVYGFQLYWSTYYYPVKCGLFNDGPAPDCSGYTGLRGIRFWVYTGFHGILRSLYNVIESGVAKTFELPVQVLMIIIIEFGLYHGAKIILGTPFVLAFLIYKWRRRHLSMYDVVEEFLQNHNNLVPIRYSYSEVRKMTKNFKDKLGEGGFGTVFKGTLRSGQLVAVKMLGKSKANGQDFINEVATIGRIHHVNVVQLIGFCVEGSKRALVYDFMSNGSLNKYIFSQEGSVLSYEKMHNIALGVARGIEYLHQGCDMQILHFDIKPHNILLDDNFTPKVSDFGLAKLYSVDDNIISLTAARGTLGYMAPELCYKNIGGISYKADVYSFGMLLMEMAGRRKNLNAFADHSSQIYFPTWVYDQLRDGKDREMEDAAEEEQKIDKKMVLIALWCIQMKPCNRPSMDKVVEMLEEDVECLQLPPKPFLSSPERQIEDIKDSSNQTCSSIELAR